MHDTVYDAFAGAGAILSEQKRDISVLRPGTFVARDGEASELIFYREPTYRDIDSLTRERDMLELFDGSYSLSYALPLMLPGPDGSAAAIVDGRLWSARRRIAGKSFDWHEMTWSEIHCQAAGEALAQLHSVSVVPGIAESLQEGLAAPEIDYIQYCLDALTRLKLDLAGIDVLRTEHFAMTDSPSCFIHGDYHPGNVIYAPDDTVKAVIDWDYSRWGKQLIDFCLGRVMFAGAFRSSPADLPEQHELALNADQSLLARLDRAYACGYKSTLARSLKTSTLYPEGIFSYEEQNLSKNQEHLKTLDEDALRPYHLIAMLLIYVFAVEQKEKPALIARLKEDISRVCALF